MSYFTWIVSVAASVVSEMHDELRQRLEPQLQRITELVGCFFAAGAVAWACPSAAAFGTKPTAIVPVTIVPAGKTKLENLQLHFSQDKSSDWRLDGERLYPDVLAAKQPAKKAAKPGVARAPGRIKVR